MSKIFRQYFKNWSGNISNKRSKLYYPKNDNNIIELIEIAKNKNLKIRVAGSKHSATPVVSDNNEKNIMIISLEKYDSDNNMIINHENKVVMVNAGWKMGQLCDELNKYNYLLETQTASTAFSIGGICCLPAHGGRLGAGIIADSVVALRLIDQNGNIVVKTEKDDDFDIYRLNHGLLGIVTHITLKIIVVNNLSAKVSSFYNIFYDDNSNNENYVLKRDIMDNYFKSIVKKCISTKKIHYTQCFIDFHNACMLAMDWVDDDKKYIVKDVYLDIRSINNYQTPEIFFSKLNKNFRKNNKLLKISGKIVRHSIMYNIENNMEKDRDMFWVEDALRSIFMAYFIPVYDSKKGFMLDNLYQAIEFVMTTVKNFSTSKRKFNIDLPMDLRFVTSSNKCKLSPLYSEHKVVYAAIELVCTAYNLETRPIASNTCLNKNTNKINYAFREFYYLIEQKWKSLGGIPHIGKIFGFGEDNCDPFNPSDINMVLPNISKISIKENAQSLFINNFYSNMIK